MKAAIRSVEDYEGKKTPAITCLLLDIGGVLLSDGWDRRARKRAVTQFKLEATEMEDRHLLTWNTYQEGKLTLEEYLDWTIFYKERPFTQTQFQHFMFSQSTSHPEMIKLIARLKRRHGLKIVVLSNEGRELNAYRIRKFTLNNLVDVYISSCFVHLLKPDADIFRLALDIAQARAENIVYIENTPLFVEIAEGLGIHSILHTDYRSTGKKLASLGLLDAEVAINATN